MESVLPMIAFLGSWPVPKERRQQAIERLRALRRHQPPDEITELEMQEIVAEVRAYRAQKRAERERAGGS